MKGRVQGRLLFRAPQLSALPADSGEIVARAQQAQASRLDRFALSIGFVAGRTRDAVFRKRIGTDVLRSQTVEVKTSQSPWGEDGERLSCTDGNRANTQFHERRKT